MKKITMQDIADRLHISKVSVSNALNGKKGVSETMKDKIITTAVKMGYVVQNSPTKIKCALIIPQRNVFSGSFTFYSLMFFHFIKIASKHYEISTFNISDEEEEECKIPFLECDIVVAIATFKGGYLNCIQKKGIKLIQVDSYKSPFITDTVYFNNFLHGYQITSYLIKEGHKNIAFIGNITSTSSRMDRFFGMRRALTENNIEFSEKNYIPYNFHEIFEGEELLLPEPRPTALVCHSDKCAYNVLQLLKKQNIHIPEDISIIGFDNIELSKTQDFLTTVNIDTELIAEKAYELLQYRISNLDAPMKILTLNGDLIIRKSVKQIT